MKTLLVLLTLLFLSAPAWALNDSKRKELQGEIRKLSERAGSMNEASSQILNRYGTTAYPALLDVATPSKHFTDSERALAFMTALRLAGPAAAEKEVIRFLSDPSWMLRLTAIKASLAIDMPKARLALLPLLEDRALVVRSAVAHGLTRVRISGATPAIQRALQSPKNMHRGKPLPIIQTLQKALTAQAIPTLEAHD